MCQEQIEAMVESHKRQRKEMEFEMYEKPYDKTAESDDTTNCWIWDRRQTYKKYIYEEKNYSEKQNKTIFILLL